MLIRNCLRCEIVTEECIILRYTGAIKKNNMSELEEYIMKHMCDVCGWDYDEELAYPEGGIAPCTKWEDIPKTSSAPCAWWARISFQRNK